MSSDLPPSRPVRILVVEDEALVSDFILMVLEDAGHDVVGVAETGADALRLADQVIPDLALLDITLRGPMDGLELARHLRERLPEVRIVFASGSHDPATRALANTFKPNGFLKKPFMPEHLTDLLNSVLEGQVRR